MTNEEALAALAHLIGTPYSDIVKGQVTECTGRTRVLGPADLATTEYDDKRIHVIAGGNGVIEGFRFA
ncbi:MAG: I78 family peptidase inhibitor [Pseudomonas sp.]|uniref:I78 family peptidase inhibitor n=1 Tax=Pseudomonas sp. TaxID=306 RepID=UPI003D0B2B89